MVASDHGRYPVTLYAAVLPVAVAGMGLHVDTMPVFSSYYCYHTLTRGNVTTFTGGTTGRALDLRSTDRGFNSYSGQKLHNNLGQVVHTYVPLLPSSITWYRPRDGDALRLER